MLSYYKRVNHFLLKPLKLLNDVMTLKSLYFISLIRGYRYLDQNVKV